METKQAKIIGEPYGGPMADGKMFGAWLSGDLLNQAEARAEASYSGNYSKYVRGLIERDVATNPHTLLIELARQHHPALVPKLERAIGLRAVEGRGADGQVVIARFLDAYLAAMDDPSFHPEQAFELLSGERRKDFEAVSEDRLEYLATRLAEFQKKPRQKKKSKHAPKATGQPKLLPHPSDKTA